MSPGSLTPASFSSYPAAGRAFALRYLALLQQMPVAICPSFLRQIQLLDTSFPAERAALTAQCSGLEGLTKDDLSARMEPLRSIKLSASLLQSDWVENPSTFIADLTAFLWSSGQIDRFRDASRALLAGLPSANSKPDRLTLVIIGRDAAPAKAELFQKLRKHGVLLTNLQSEAMDSQMLTVFMQRATTDPTAYAHWYIDGGEPWLHDFSGLPGTVSTSYPELDLLRRRTLQEMQKSIASGSAGVEFMRAKLASTVAGELGTAGITPDAILQRFYTELFTESSGPQIFSTSFVQWAGREVARRAQPRTLMLRYAPRQSYRPFNEMIEDKSAAPAMDPEGSLRDADMGAYYAWLEMERITAPGRGTFAVWLEASRQMLVISAHSPAGTTTDSALSLQQALKAFA